MTLEQLATLAALLVQTAALVWWAATLNSTVKSHDKQLLDHEERLRKGSL